MHHTDYTPLKAHAANIAKKCKCGLHKSKNFIQTLGFMKKISDLKQMFPKKS